ncbi:LysE/ArgO family amino acid transporter [Desmospora profundinema]|uniref:L-lysine exporter family protein LysE/ArgO n=1 Tax=Desmospora profundinema TaxID=1571184 RepID=A0ABU1ING8_9BACL|nr:LysE/ArgO family amino acid transporter [Desmospora profundinema]MDR6226331.1 L-lysine exporter family protein LysE/ArgO [Desmospora profundinema]
MLEAILHGVVLAFGLIIPLGAQNVFVFNQGANQPTFLRALPVVLTASICDSLLILLAVLGVSLIVLSMPWLQLGLFSVGFFFLLYMGWSVWKSNPSSASETTDKPLSAKRQIGFAASVSLLNPHAIMDTIGVIGTSSLNYAGLEKWLFTISCIIISWLWFIGLAIAGRWLKTIDQSGTWLLKLNQISAFIIWGVALYIGNLIVRELVL